MVNVCEVGPGTNFDECSAMITTHLQKAGFDPVILEETKNWTAAKGRKFDLAKGGDQTVNIPDSMK